MTQTLFIVCALGRIQSLVESVQNFTLKKAQLLISHTDCMRTSNVTVYVSNMLAVSICMAEHAYFEKLSMYECTFVN